MSENGKNTTTDTVKQRVSKNQDKRVKEKPKTAKENCKKSTDDPNKTTEKSVESEKEEEYTYCGKCDEYLPDNTEDETVITTIGCDICLRWFHITCAKVSMEKWQLIKEHDVHWYCDQCNFAAKKLHQEVLSIKAQNLQIQKQMTKLDSKVSQVEASIDEKIKSATENLRKEITNNIDVDSKIKASTDALKTEITNSIKNDLRTEMANTVISILEIETKNMKDELKKELNLEDDSSELESDSENEDESDNSPKSVSYAQATVAGTKKVVQKLIKELTPAQIQEQWEEKDRREHKKNNLIIFNLKEKPGDKENDLKAINEVLKNKLKLNIEIKKSMRIGTYCPEKTRPIKIVMENTDSKKQILSKAAQLREIPQDDPYAKIYIRPDLTKLQLEESKNLYQQLVKTREKHPNQTWKIVRGKIQEVNN